MSLLVEEKILKSGASGIFSLKDAAYQFYS